MPGATRVLVVDVGNTNVVFGLWDDDRLLGSWRLSNARERTSDEFGILARQILAPHAASSIEGSIVASVVPGVNATIAEMLRTYFGSDPLFIEPGIRTGLSIHTENPLEVGADRIANAVAAFERFGGPTIVVDFGTATTFDLISATGEYRGGVIAPGLTISAEALFARAARLPRVDLRKPAQLIGTNTIASMQSGIWYGYLGLVDGILTRMKEEIRDLRRIVATGAHAPLLVGESRHIDEVDADLTLAGLRLVYERNRKGSGRRRR
jgi:type III pantothenate kinase